MQTGNATDQGRGSFRVSFQATLVFLMKAMVSVFFMKEMKEKFTRSNRHITETIQLPIRLHYPTRKKYTSSQKNVSETGFHVVLDQM